jgi:hypothetical protein
MAGFASALDEGFRAGGWPAAVRNAIQALLAQRDAKANYVAAFRIAQLYAELGDRDHAFEWLNIARQEHNLWIPTLRTDFTFNSLHSDPRYTALVQKIGFPQYDHIGRTLLSAAVGVDVGVGLMLGLG